MAFNRELADRIIEQIETHPEQWDQGNWSTFSSECGTVCCVAGWACELSGIQTIPWSGVTTLEGRIKDTARHLLGLDVYQADSLFQYTMTHDVDVIKRKFKEFEEENA
jgi:hypothetical protein